MNQEQVNQLLAEIVSMYAPAPGKKGAKWVVSKLPMSSAEEQIPIGSLPYTAAKAAFLRCGTILREDQGAFAGVILAGVMDMNPAFVIIWTEDTILHIFAQAKEGLIKQHTAEKAIQKLKSALSFSQNTDERRRME